VAAKMLGVGADVYMGNNTGSKYEPPKERPASEAPSAPAAKTVLEGIVESVNKREGTTNGRAWTVYDAVLSGGKKACTFSEDFACDLRDAIGLPVKLGVSQTKKGGWDITRIEVVDTSAPDLVGGGLPF
jgi:hypothetical protein